MTVPVLQVKNLYKLFIPLEHSQNEKKAMTMLKQGASRTEVQEATGITAGLIDINFTVNKGEVFVLIGLSGSGKSTLINMIAGIDRPTGGEVWVAGTPVHSLTENQIAVWRGRTVGVVFQFFQLLPTLTALENVMIPMDFCNVHNRAERPERAMALLDLVGVADQADKLPSSLSGGQQQRVAIARSLANDPPLLVADEPTGNLDAHTAASVIDLFADLARGGKTILMVTHDLDLARQGSRILTVADGRIESSALVGGPAP